MSLSFASKRVAYMRGLWRNACFLCICFLLGFYFNIDFNGILMAAMTAGVGPLQQVQGIRLFVALLLVAVLLWAWHMVPAPLRANETSLWMLVQAMAYVFKFGWGLWISSQWLPFMQTVYLGVTPASYPYGVLNCSVSRLDNATFVAVHGWAPKDARVFFMTLAAQLITGTVVLLVMVALIWMRVWRGEIAKPPMTWAAAREFLFATNDPFSSFQFTYSFSMGWWLAVSIIPGWALWWSGGSTCGVFIAFLDMVSLIIVFTTMILLRVFVENTGKPLMDERLSVFADTTLDGLVQWVRNSFGFTFATMCALLVTYAFSPALTSAMFNVSIEWGFYPAVTGAGNMTPWILFGVTAFFALFFLLAWALFEYCFPSPAGRTRLGAPLVPLADMDTARVVFDAYKRIIPNHVYDDLMTLNKDNQPVEGIDREPLLWARLTSPDLILLGPKPPADNKTPLLTAPEFVDDQATLPGVWRSGFLLAIAFSIAYLWMWFFADRFESYLLVPIYPAANVDSALLAPQQFIANLVLTAIGITLTVMFDAAWVRV